MTPQHPVRHWMALPPSIQDFNKALKRMRPGKAPGPDNIPLELLTHSGLEMRNRLMLLILKIWETKTLPRDFRDRTVVIIFKMGDRREPGISLLSIASKVFARIPLDRLLVLAEDVLPESQCGFRPFRWTIDREEPRTATARNIHLLGPKKDLR
ncbi:unnamed protein product [Acanthosepion pharaonis]|uniref:Reverse transcriptase domain-containing protein n=1 Tax=Acanthosepion pharaonis TaxID=158019 RepID=A0A812BKV8_ACAPH|nr:unnamed protein product [Sepia pharaonis]